MASKINLSLSPYHHTSPSLPSTKSNSDPPNLPSLVPSSGNVTPYQFFLPPTWTQARIANILSGNYCQPKCAEPWIEVKFEDPKQGTLLVVASPMVRLTNKAQQKIEQIGTPDKIIAALGSFVTGDSFDPDEVVETRVEKRDDQTVSDALHQICSSKTFVLKWCGM